VAGRECWKWTPEEEVVRLLDLDVIFDPDRVEAVAGRGKYGIGAKSGGTPLPPSMDLVRSLRPEDLDPDWRMEWEERAAIMEYDGGLPREQADAMALAEIVPRMQQMPVRSVCGCRLCRGESDTCV
jgi:hypothetical protein